MKVSLRGKAPNGARLFIRGKGIAYHIVHWMILYGVQSHHGKFKSGDKVRYNWKAKVMLGKIYNERKGHVFTVKNVWGKEGSNIEFEDNAVDCSGCDVFWINKVA